ncbi:MAG: histidine phosphatase family protein [Proteobacteria bacterium]|nr:histidine phosphatase family protein [Pseudomonadota bacterium]
MSVIHMVRHGQASFGKENYDQLSPLGMRQAEILAARLDRAGPEFDSLYAGNMVRHRQTAAPFARISGGEPLIQSHFDEFDAMPVWNSEIGRLVSDDPEAAADLALIPTDSRAFDRVFGKVMMRWVKGDVDPSVAGQWREFTERVRLGVNQLMETHGSGKDIVVFTSAGPIAATARMALSLSDEKTMEMAFQIWNASVTRFRYGPRGITLLGFNEVSHLEAEADPALITIR